MQFIGNTKTFNLLAKSLKSGLLNHAYIFSGPEHVGKITLAKMFALHAIDGTQLSADMDDFSKEALFDLIVVAPEIVEKNSISKQRDISVESIREAKLSLSLFPYHGKYKILIIEDAHKLNTAAQNALLKILEEPNQTTIMILVTHEVDRLLATIKSRCQMVNFGLISDEDMQRTFPENIVSISAGRPGLARTLINDDEQRIFRTEAIANLKKISNGALNEKFILAEEFSKDTVKTLEKLNAWTWEMRKKALALDGKEREKIYADIEKIQTSMETLKRTNAGSRLVLEVLFMDI